MTLRTITCATLGALVLGVPEPGAILVGPVTRRLTAADFDDVAYLVIGGDYTAENPTCKDSVIKIHARRAAGLPG